ncbi:MAG: hypothetical protein ACRDOU_28990 [Streptosporangiaceae bacterium]
MLLEHSPAAGAGDDEESLDLVQVDVHGEPRWTRVWPSDEDNPRHAELEAWMAAHGHQIVSRAASESGWCQDKDD